MEEVPCVTLLLREPLIHAFRKAIDVMKHLAEFMTLKTVGSDLLRMSVLDHLATGGMYVDIPVARHGKPDVWVNLVSQHLFQLSKALSKSHILVLSLHTNSFASFLNPSTNKPIVPDVVFTNVEPLLNQFHSIDSCDYVMVEMISQDLLNILTSLDSVSPIVQLNFRSCGTLRLMSSSMHGTIRITKRLHIGAEACENDCESGCKRVVKQVYVPKFAKQLVNSLVNSSVKHCWFGIPKTTSQPLVVKFLDASDIFMYYLMFPLVPQLEHTMSDTHPQATIHMNTSIE